MTYFKFILFFFTNYHRGVRFLSSYGIRLPVAPFYIHGHVDGYTVIDDKLTLARSLNSKYVAINPTKDKYIYMYKIFEIRK